MYINRRSVVRWTVLTSLIILLLGYFILPWFSINTDIAYPLLREQWKDEELIHFPINKPKKSKTVDFNYNPGQSEDKRMIWIISFGNELFTNELNRLTNISSTNDANKHGISYLSHRQSSILTHMHEGFSIRILHAIPGEQIDELNPWKNGYARGYSFKEDSKEIAYWIERW